MPETRSGFLLLHKPPGPSSNQALQEARWKLGKPKMGHAGTLDPFAEGLLVCGIGPATRLLDLVMDFPKTYRAVFRLGQRTDTEDLTGQVLYEKPVTALIDAQIQGLPAFLLSQTSQIPPSFSAIKVGGQKMYDLARKGQAPELPQRPITVYQAQNLSSTEDRLSMDLEVSKGTYIRGFCGPLENYLDQPLTLVELVRLNSGPFFLKDAHLPADLTPDTPLIPPEEAASALPRLDLSDHAAKKALLGQKLGPHDVPDWPLPAEEKRIAVFHHGKLLGLAKALPELVHVDRVLARESSDMA